MFQIKRALPAACLFLLVLSSCKKESRILTTDTYNYFPTDQGVWVEYRVDSIYHSENDNDNDDSVYTYNFEIREEIDSSFLDGSGRLSQVIHRYKRENAQEPWTLTDVWTQHLTKTAAYRKENNVYYHKLSFPLSLSVYWNGNDANTMEEQLYSYEYYHEPGVFQSIHFDSTLSVLQIDENNFVERMYGREVYAAGVGLIYKVYDNLGKKNGVVVKGLEYTMIVTAYGKN